MKPPKKLVPSVYVVGHQVRLRTVFGEVRLGRKTKLAQQLARDHAEIYSIPVICVQKGLIRR